MLVLKTFYGVWLTCIEVKTRLSCASCIRNIQQGKRAYLSKWSFKRLSLICAVQIGHITYPGGGLDGLLAAALLFAVSLACPSVFPVDFGALRPTEHLSEHQKKAAALAQPTSVRMTLCMRKSAGVEQQLLLKRSRHLLLDRCI